MNNLELVKTQLTKVTRPLDGGGYADALAGQVFECWVNAPRVVEMADAQGNPLDGAARKVVAILFELPLDVLKDLDDAFVLWLYTAGLDLYFAYHNDLRKKTDAS